MLKSLFRKKTISALNKESSSSNTLIRSIGPIQLILLGVGSIIGGGVFVLTGTAAFKYTGPAIVLSFTISGIVCIFAGLCYAEFASMIPVSGSSYTYSYVTLGELPAWLMGCSTILSYFLSAASVASGWSSYFIGLIEHFGLHIPEKISYTTGYPYSIYDGVVSKSIFNLPALFIPIITTLILLKGTRSSSIINSIAVIIKMTILSLFVIVGSTKVNLSNWTPFIPKNTGNFGDYGYSGIIAGVSMVFLAFNGFDSICTAAQEVKNPQRNLPIGIIGSILIAMFTYTSVSAVLTGVVNYKNLNTAQPLALAAEEMNIPIFSLLIKFGAVSAITSVLLVHQYAIVRIVYTIAKDGLLPSVLKKMHNKSHIPYVSTIITGVLIGMVAGTTNLEEIVKLSTFFILLTIIVVCFSTIYLRYKEPHIERKFKCPMVPWIPIIAILFSLQILFRYPIITTLYGMSALLVCMIYYIYYGRHRSALIE